MNSKVSIVIPVYNSEAKLKSCLGSIINQTYKNFEVILINDGSVDSSGSICDYYSKLDNRFLVQHCKNRGVSSARNKGIDLASGKYLVFVDSDDTIKCNMLESMVSHIEKSDADILISGISFIEDRNLTKEIIPSIQGKIGIEVWKYICEDTVGIYGYVPNKMYRMQIIKDSKIYFDEKRQIQEDLDFALRAYSRSDSFYLLGESYYLYDYEEKNRKPDCIGYMEIEINKRNILKDKNIFEKYDRLHYQKLSNMIFSYLYHIPKEKRNFYNYVNKLYKLDNIYDSLSINHIKPIEQKFVIFLLKSHFINSLRVYFISRQNIKEILSKILSN